MVNGLLGWFRALSLMGKIGIVGTAVFGTTAFANVVAPPTVEIRREVRTEQIDFETKEIKDSALNIGDTKVKTAGQTGSKEITYDVTYTDGQETNKKHISERLISNPVTQILLVGTREVVNKEVKETILFTTTYRNDASIAAGKTQTTVEGVPGEKILTYQIVKIDGKEVSNKLLKETVTKQPVSRIVLRGTRSCDSNYSPCVPVVGYDLDCADIGHSVTVISGYDPHRFDADYDGYGCESY